MKEFIVQTPDRSFLGQGLEFGVVFLRRALAAKQSQSEIASASPRNDNLQSAIRNPQFFSRITIYFLLFTVLTGCIPQKVVRPPNPANPIRVVAVLPILNNTNDVIGPQFIRRQIVERLPIYHYKVQPIKDVDVVLRDQMGITLGSQLDMTNPQELGKVLESDAVIYGTLMDFNTKITGFQNLKEVRAKFKMVDAKTGEVIWENGIGVKNELTSGLVGDVMSTVDTLQQITQQEEVPWVKLMTQKENNIGMALGMALAEKIISQAAEAPLALEVNQMLDIVLEGYYQPPPMGFTFPPPVPYGRPIPVGPGR